MSLACAYYAIIGGAPVLFSIARSIDTRCWWLATRLRGLSFLMILLEMEAALMAPQREQSRLRIIVT
jgi:hypothetical protein